MSTVQEATGGNSDLVRKFIGQTVFTDHTGKILHYKVVDITDKPVGKLFVHKLTMVEYFLKKHRTVLLHPECVALVCKGSNIIPLELARVVKEEEISD